MTRPAVADPPPWRFPEPRSGRLANGLGVRGCHLPGQELATARLVLGAGAAAEPAGSYGAAYVAVSAVVRGGLAEAAEDLGASVNAEVSWDAASFVVTAPRTAVEEALRLVARAVGGVHPDAVQRVRAARLDALRHEPPAARAEAALSRALFGDSRYGVPLGGTSADVEALAPEAVASFLRAAADPARATLVVAADCDCLDPVALAERCFGDHAAEPGAAPATARAPDRPGVVTALVEIPGAAQSAVVLGCVTPPRDDPSYAALALATHALSAAPRARLNLRLRERERVAYGVRGGLEGWRATGRWTAAFACPATATRTAVDAALDEVSEVASGGLTAEEIAAVRGHFVGSLPLHLHTPPALAADVAGNVATGLADDASARLRDEVARCGDDDVRAAAARHLSGDRVCAAVAGALS